jgi:membrane fusion protein (multidrug efflux system)
VPITVRPVPEVVFRSRQSGLNLNDKMLIEGVVVTEGTLIKPEVVAYKTVLNP